MRGVPKEEEVRATTALLIESYWADGMSARAIAERTGLTKNEVSSFVLHHRDLCPPRYRDTRRHERMRELWATDLTVAEIADTLGMSADGVSSYAAAHRDEFPARRPGPRKGRF